MSAVVVEEKLKALFGLIPEGSFMVGEVSKVRKKPHYYFGDSKECNALIKLHKHDIYPLIFQTSTSETQDIKAKSVTTELELVIATQNTDISLLNDKRWATSYRNVLMPTVNNVYQALNESNIVLWESEYTLEKVPNYSQTDTKDANAIIDIVDAVIFRATIKISGKGCNNKNIKFNN